MRLSQRLKRTGKRRSTLPPTELEREAKITALGQKAKMLRELPADDPRVRDTVTEMLDAGYTLREYDGPEPRRWPLLPEWGGKEPPEIP